MGKRTKAQRLLRNRPSGQYYGLFAISFKQKWQTPGTDVLAPDKLGLAGRG